MLKGVKVLITSGGTREKIDPVRYIGNYSSGRTGTALADAFAAAGAEVTVIAGPGDVHYNQKMIRVESAIGMLEAVQANLPADIVVFAAAVADKRPKNFSVQKIKKENLNLIELVENPDILQTIATSSNRPKMVVGFAMESENHEKNALEKLTNKSCDLIVLNDINAIGALESECWVFGKDFSKKMEKAPKKDIAEGIIKIIGEFYGSGKYQKTG